MMIDNTLTTQRLFLRAPRADDGIAYAESINDREIVKFLTKVPFPLSPKEAQNFLSRFRTPTPDRACFIIGTPTERLIGCITLEEELRFWITRPHWGKGYAIEAAIAVLDWYFAQTKTQGVRCSAHWDNTTSLDVQTKLGFEQVGFDTRFSLYQQREIKHITTYLDRKSYANRGGQL
jgi:RimJ/RimL family protein N-acetyltransferase